MIRFARASVIVLAMRCASASSLASVAHCLERQ